MVVFAVGVCRHYSFIRVAKFEGMVGEGKSDDGFCVFEEESRVASYLGVVFHIFHSGVHSEFEPMFKFCPFVRGDGLGLGHTECAGASAVGCVFEEVVCFLRFIHDVKVINKSRRSKY